MYDLILEKAKPTDSQTISFFIRQVFDQSVALHYTDQGNQEFYKYIVPDAIADRLRDNHWILMAYLKNDLIGIIVIRDNNHLSMLFVDTLHQRQGIGHFLFKAAIKKCHQLNTQLKTMTVHSSPNSITAYERLGFVIKDKEKEINGIRFTTMELTLQHYL
jgi:GNAT superfamily N-acetyltransferase